MNKEKIHISIDKSVLEKLEKIAKQRGLRTNELVRVIIAEYLFKKVD